jgi:trehalose-6-phosphatase
VTDEDAFSTLKDRGIGVVVMDLPRDTEAHYRLKNTDEVKKFLKKLMLLASFSKRSLTKSSSSPSPILPHQG